MGVDKEKTKTKQNPNEEVDQQFNFTQHQKQ